VEIEPSQEEGLAPAVTWMDERGQAPLPYLFYARLLILLQSLAPPRNFLIVYGERNLAIIKTLYLIQSR
jgi:hypothetical protein